MKKLHKQARELLQAASKVYDYRRDQIVSEDLAELERLAENLKTVIKEKGALEASCSAAMEPLHAHLVKIGGKIYPKTFLSDNIEVILVAAIVVIGIRSFFFQPFIIPTNSMYPTYSGMKERIYAADETPTAPRKVFNFLTQGARHHNLVATASGELSIEKARTQSGTRVPFYEVVKGRKWFGLFPAQFKEYTLYVGNTPHYLQVPAEFQMDAVLESLQPVEGLRQIPSSDRRLERWATGRKIKAGEPILAFDIRLGDALFVDRLTYHFRKPKVGDPFVFRTNQILDAVGKATGDYTPKYYIKRLAGKEGETLEIKDHTLMVDGRPRDEVAAFERNAAQEGEYVGYKNVRRMADGATMKVPEGSFVALGDNSANSADSRYWGYVPQESVVGRAIFIYYPFTQRWGPSE
ncbi:MAG: signal peptidase I [Verrucomicrobia bacterium]|nr:signal peptidase I [Verrucomicrobiota bacterium]